MKERASPRRDVCFVPRKHSAEPRGVGTLHGLTPGLQTRYRREFSTNAPTAVILSVAIRRIAESKRKAQAAKPFESRGGRSHGSFAGATCGRPLGM